MQRAKAKARQLQDFAFHTLNVLCSAFVFYPALLRFYCLFEQDEMSQHEWSAQCAEKHVSFRKQKLFCVTFYASAVACVHCVMPDMPDCALGLRLPPPPPPTEEAPNGPGLAVNADQKAQRRGLTCNKETKCQMQQRLLVQAQLMQKLMQLTPDQISQLCKPQSPFFAEGATR